MSDLEFRCNRCQKTWKDYRVNIMQKVKRNTFNCPHCNKKTKEILYREFQELAHKKGGKLLSPEFYGISKYHKWKCGICGCVWEAKPNCIKDYPSKKGTWCPKCGYESMKKNLQKYTIKDMQKLANSKPGGGKCLSKKYLGVTKYHKWKCGTCGNIWKAKPHDIMGKPSRPDGTWCPKCAKGRIERICRAFFEELFGVPFKTESNLEWLKKYRLHLDGYNRELKIAFERHGIQHYKYQSFFHRSDPKEFEKRLAIDEYKRKMSKKHGIILIEVGYEWRNGKLYKIPIDEMEDYIRKKCEEKGVSVPKNDKKINWRKFNLSEPDKVKELQELAESRNGKLISTHYFGQLIKLKWYCNKHHYSWYAPPNDIRGKPSKPKGTWCPKCALENHSKLMKKKVKQRSRDKNGKFR